jgi:Protein of unknown function (DUF3575)
MNDTTRTLVSATVLAFSLAAAAPARAEDTAVDPGTLPPAVAAARYSGPDVTLTFQPLALFAESTLVDAQLRLGKHVSFGLSGRYVSPAEKGVTGSAWGGSLGLQYHFSETFRGFYVYPRVLLERTKLEKGSEVFEGQVVAPSITLGHQWRTGVFFLRLGGGAGYLLPLAGSPETAGVISRGLLAVFDIDSGLAF